MSETIRVADYVREAIAAGRPVVALESTIFTHGLTRPRNIEVALDAEQRLRDSGVLPATIGVVDGTPTVGLSEQQIRMLGAEDVPVVKLGVRDLPVAAAKQLHGGTTVSATALLAHRAGPPTCS
ncbi:pseudouridine-5'-phosphate glycosidase, partial [Rhodococcus sp. IITR03]